MPRYFFSVCNSDGVLPDEEGQEFADLAEAKAEALRAIRSLVSDECKSAGRVDLRARLNATDESGDMIFVVPFSEAIEVLTGPPPSAESIGITDD